MGAKVIEEANDPTTIWRMSRRSIFSLTNSFEMSFFIFISVNGVNVSMGSFNVNG